MGNFILFHPSFILLILLFILIIKAVSEISIFSSLSFIAKILVIIMVRSILFRKGRNDLDLCTFVITQLVYLLGPYLFQKQIHLFCL